jgi:hypothetical protein
MNNVGVLIYTYNRVDDAKVNMEIIRNVWKKKKSLSDVHIIHAFNGEKQWYPKKYFENRLITIKNSWHFQGASDLIDAGMRAFEKEKHIDYVIVLASDTWLVKPDYVERLIHRMRTGEYHFGTCAWGIPERNQMHDVGVAVDFFIIDLKWANATKMFPLRYGAFQKKYEDLLLYHGGSSTHLEKLLFARYLQATNREGGNVGSLRKQAFEKILRLKEREPIHPKKGSWTRTMYWSKMGLLTHHDPVTKKKLLKQLGIKGGKEIEKLLHNKNLSYFNQGVTRMEGNVN